MIWIVGTIALVMLVKVSRDFLRLTIWHIKFRWWQIMNISVLRCLAEAYLAAVDGSTRDAELRGLRNLPHTW